MRRIQSFLRLGVGVMLLAASLLLAGCGGGHRHHVRYSRDRDFYPSYSHRRGDFDSPSFRAGGRFDGSFDRPSRDRGLASRPGGGDPWSASPRGRR